MPTAPNVAPTGTLDHHFLRGKRHRADELGDAVVQTRNWRLTALGAICGMLCFGVGCIYLGAQPKLKPYYIEVDTCGGHMRVVGQGPDVYTPGENVIKKQLREFVQTLRGVSTDKVLMRQQWAIAFYQLTPRAKQRFAEYAIERKPLEQREPVMVEVLRVLPKTDTTYDVRWHETTYSPKGERLESHAYSGLFTIILAVPQTKEQMDWAPTGVLIDQFSWSAE